MRMKGTTGGAKLIGPRRLQEGAEVDQTVTGNRMG